MERLVQRTMGVGRDEVQEGLNHRQSLSLDSDVCLNLGVRKPLPFVNRRLVGSDVTRMPIDEFGGENRQEGQKEGIDLTQLPSFSVPPAISILLFHHCPLQVLA